MDMNNIIEALQMSISPNEGYRNQATEYINQVYINIKQLDERKTRLCAYFIKDSLLKYK
jgi:hypothetical protein